jgi:hypothetical protein
MNKLLKRLGFRLLSGGCLARRRLVLRPLKCCLENNGLSSVHRGYLHQTPDCRATLSTVTVSTDACRFVAGSPRHRLVRRNSKLKRLGPDLLGAMDVGDQHLPLTCDAQLTIEQPICYRLGGPTPPHQAPGTPALQPDAPTTKQKESCMMPVMLSTPAADAVFCTRSRQLCRGALTNHGAFGLVRAGIDWEKACQIYGLESDSRKQDSTAAANRDAHIQTRDSTAATRDSTAEPS